ncbi:MAG: zinc ribbon domain-containing protein [Anaerolineae bacterium]|nr:zinc ribbon domain-containing protein [Anaerolineae bacterium]
MPTYYGILKLQSTANTAEIEAAIEAQYNQCRRLITHQNPETVNKANQALLLLEKIRTTLTDPAQRAAYDASIGLSNAVGGLADPQVKLQLAPPPPLSKLRPGSHESVTSVVNLRADTWICPKCQASSSIGTRFCKQCGQMLARNCPRCDRLIEAVALFCSECGVDIKRYLEEQTQLSLQLAREQTVYVAQEQKRKRQSNSTMKYGVIFLLIVIILIVVCGLAGVAAYNLVGGS